MKDYILTVIVDTEKHTIFVKDSEGTKADAYGYLIVVGRGDKGNDLVTAYGNTEAIAEAFANAYGTAQHDESPTGKSLLKLFSKCIKYARTVSAHFQQEITSEQALEKFGADVCKCEGNCICKKGKVFH